MALASFIASAADAAAVYRGKKGRRYLRHSLLSSKLTADKLTTYNTYGYPVHRLRVNGYGKVLEHWTYYEIGKEFIFDEDSKLVKVNKFWPEDRRERFRQN